MKICNSIFLGLFFLSVPILTGLHGFMSGEFFTSVAFASAPPSSARLSTPDTYNKQKVPGFSRRANVSQLAKSVQQPERGVSRHTTTGMKQNGARAKRTSVLSGYRLGVGDVIQINVFEEPDLSLEVRLSDAGTISYPLLGEISALGLTPGSLERQIANGLKGRYLVDPRVNVSVREYRKYFIRGEVTRPGGYTFIPGVTVGKAISIAGGLTERASRKKVYVARDGATDDSKKAERVSMNRLIQPGELIMVEESFF